MVIKKSFINYIVECYKNFPELLEMFPKEKLKSLLNMNISKIKRCKVNEHYSGQYSSSRRSIKIANENKLDIDKIKSSKFLTQVAVHEATHGLFKNGKKSTGTMKECIEATEERVKLKKESENVKYKRSMFIKEMLFNRKIDFTIGRAMNEGFTEWVTKKTVGTFGGYDFERQIIELIECVKGTKETLNIGKGNYEEISEFLNMDKKTFFEFMTKFDFLHELSENQDKNDNKLFFYKKVVSKMLVDKLVLPELEHQNDFSAENFEKILNLERKLEKIYYNHLFNYTKSFDEDFQHFKNIKDLYLKNSQVWLKEYNEKFEELDDSQVKDLQYVIFNNLEVLNSKEANNFIKKMLARDQVNIDNIKENIKANCMNEERINLSKVREIINYSYKIDICTIYGDSQIVQMLLGKELHGEEEAQAVMEFRDLASSMSENGEINQDTKFFNKERFKILSEKELENGSESEIIDIEEEIDNKELESEENTSYNFFKIIGKSISKYKLKLKEVVKNPIRYFRQKQQRGDDGDER